MKKFYALGLTMLIASISFGQSQMAKELPTSKKNVAEKKNISISSRDAKFAKNAVLTQDFEGETFPPEGWTTVDGAASSGDQTWHVRDNYPISGSSPIVGTGKFAFVNYSAGGGSTAPAEQDEWLISPEFEVPSNGVLSFDANTQAYWNISPNDNADIKICLTDNDGATWTEIWNETDYYELDTIVTFEWFYPTIDLTPYAGQSLKLGINYTGNDGGYFAIDNIQVKTVLDYDFEMIEPVVLFNPQFINYGYNGTYSNIPSTQIDDNTFNMFSSIVKNYGSQAITVKMDVKVYNSSDDEVFSYTSPELNVPSATFVDGISKSSQDTIKNYTSTADGNSIIEEGIWYMDATPGIYTYVMTISAVGTEYTNPNNRILEKRQTVEITDCLYSRDNGNPSESATIATIGTFSESMDLIGVNYQVRNASTQINTVDVYITDESSIGSTFNVQILIDQSEDGSWDFQPIVQTDAVTVEELGWISLTFLDNMDFSSLEEGYYSDFLLAVASTDSISIALDETVIPQNMDIKMRRASTGEFSWASGFAGIPMIRFTTCEPEIGENVNSFAMSEIEMYPNPSNGTVNFNNVNNATIEVYNLVGQLVASVNSNSENTSIDLSNTAEGSYIVRVVKDGVVSTSKLNIVK